MVISSSFIYEIKVWKCANLLFQLAVNENFMAQNYQEKDANQLWFSYNYFVFCSSILFADYVEEIFQTYLQSSKEELTDAIQKLKEMTPAPMNSMLDKQPREDALQKRSERSSMLVSDVPPTTPGIFSIASVMSEKRGKHSENWRNLESQKHCGHYNLYDILYLHKTKNIFAEVLQKLIEKR